MRSLSPQLGGVTPQKFGVTPWKFRGYRVEKSALPRWKFRRNPVLNRAGFALLSFQVTPQVVHFVELGIARCNGWKSKSVVKGLLNCSRSRGFGRRWGVHSIVPQRCRRIGSGSLYPFATANGTDVRHCTRHPHEIDDLSHRCALQSKLQR